MGCSALVALQLIVIGAGSTDGPFPSGVVDIMKFSPQSLAFLAWALPIASTHAAMLGVTSTNYQVVDGARRFSVMDVYVDCSGRYDKLVNFYGQTTSTSMVRTSLNGVLNGGSAYASANGASFAQASGTGWIASASARGNAWDSFVSIGARTQDEALGVVTSDPYFMNATTSGAGTIAGGSTSQGAYAGAGWFTNLPAGSHTLAGSYEDLRIMLGRFSVETTNLSATDVLALQFKGNVTMKVNGSSAGAGTTLQTAVDQTFTYGFVPAPGACALLGMAGLRGRRRRCSE
jgi:hypothetical protein